MKTTKLIMLCTVLIAVFAIAFTSCKKENKSGNDTSSIEQMVQDENRMALADDETMNDVNTVLSGNGNGNGFGNKSLQILPCNAIIDSSFVIADTITYLITFNGANCHGNQSRVGNVEIKKHINTHWTDSGATVYVKYINLVITRGANNKSLTLNGTRKFVNVSGGRIFDLGTTATSVVHRIYGNLSATFDDGTTRTWFMARQRAFTGTPGNLILTVDGLGSSGGYNSLVAWGINRQGEQFYTQITQSVIHKETCGWDPCAGVKVHSIPALNSMATFTAGFDNNDQPVPVSGNICPTKYRIDWQNNGTSGTIYKYL